MPGFSFAEGGYVPLGPSGVTVANSELDVYILHWIRLCAMDRTVYGCMGCMVIWLYGYMAQFEWKIEWRSVCGTCRSGGAFNLGRRH